MTTDKTLGEYRDSSGRTLADYPRPSVAVDTALLTLVPDKNADLHLGVLEVRRHDRTGWGLPGTFLHPGERLIDAVQRALRVKAGVEGLSPRQLHVFDDLDRDDRGWVLSVAHIDVVPIVRLHDRHLEQTRIQPADAPGRLPYGQEHIVARAVEDLRRRYAEAPDPDSLLLDAFTLRELRQVHETIAGRSIQRDAFRRAMEGQLIPTGRHVARGRGRPAELFTRRSAGSGS